MQGRFGDEGGRQSVLTPMTATAGPQAPVEHDDTRYVGMVERHRNHNDRHLWYQPRERTDPGIGEAIEKVREEFTKDVPKFLRAKHRADTSSGELATVGDEKMTLLEGIRPSTSVTTLAELDETMEGAKTEQLVLAVNMPQGSTRGQALEDGVPRMFKLRKKSRH